MSQKNFMSYGDAETIFTELGSKLIPQFVGTQAAWNLLSTAEKKKYKQAIFTDDYDNNPVGNLNALTTTDKSSAVAAINELVSNKCNNLITQWFSVAGQSVQPERTTDYDFDITKSGYTALSVAGFFIGGGGSTTVVSAYIRGTTSARVRILNAGSEAIVPNDINICILYSAT